MKHHTKIYFDYFGYGEQDFVFCEVHWAEGIECRAVDIMHIDARGMGGNPSGDKDAIENLMAGCRAVHLETGDKKQYKDYLQQIHLDFMAAFKSSNAKNA